MHYHTTLALVAATSGLCGAASLPATTMRLVWRYAALKSGSLVAIDVFNGDNTAQLTQASTCFPYAPEYTVNSGAFKALPLVMSVDKSSGFDGTIVFDGTTYALEDDAATNNGASCVRMYNSDSAYIECMIPVSAGKLSESFPISEGTDCLSSHLNGNSALLARSAVTNIGASMKGAVAPKNETNGTSLAEVERRNPGIPPQCTTGKKTEKVGGGDPHQNALNIQLSENIHCAADSCSVGSSQSESFTIDYSATASLFGWISGGFSVSETTTTGNSYTCDGKAGQTVCVWKNVAHTAYTVHNCNFVDCNGDPKTTCGGNIVVESPNIDNSGGGYYCVLGASYCRSQGSRYWK